MSFRVLFPNLESLAYNQSRRVQHPPNDVCRRYLSLNSAHLDVKPRTLRRRRESVLAQLDEQKFRKKIITRDGLSIKLLTPVVLSARITKLFRQGQLQEAIDMVRHSPSDAQNAAVWTTLIGFVMSEKRYKEAYKLFTEANIFYMKRRGVRPSIRTFGALLQGYNQIMNWKAHSVQLNNVHTIRDQLLRFFKERGQDEEINIIPFNSLIKVYGKAGEYQKMYDVYNEMDKRGPLAPDIYTFTILLNAISNRKTLDAEHPELYGYSDVVSTTSSDQGSGAFENVETSEVTRANDPTIAYKNASDARLIWKELLEVCRTPDSFAVRAIIVLLAKGRPSDQNLALNICHEFLALSPPGEKPKEESLIPIHAQVLNVLLSMCNNSGRHRHTLHYIKQLSDPQRMGVLATEHMNLALEARAILASSERLQASEALETLKWMLGMAVIPKTRVFEAGLGSQIKPTRDTYDLVGLTCFYAKDWYSLSETFEIMLSKKIEDFSNPSSISPKILDSGPSGSFVACMLRTAVECGDMSNALAVLDVMQYFRMRLIQLLSRSSLTGEQNPSDYIHANRLANAIAATVSLIKDYAATSRPELKAHCSFWIRKASEYGESSRSSTKTALKRHIP